MLVHAIVCAWVVSLAVAPSNLSLAIARAPRLEPKRVAPKKLNGKQRRARRRSRDLSSEGTQRGDLEFALASVVAVMTGVMVGRGAWEASQIPEARRCDEVETVRCQSLQFTPTSLSIAAGLSFGLAVPMGAASGLLFLRAVRTRRSWKAWRAQERAAALSWVPTARGGGLAVRLRF